MASGRSASGVDDANKFDMNSDVSCVCKFKNSFHFIVSVGGAAGPSEEASSSGATPGSKRKGAAGPEKVAKKVRFAEKTSMTNTKEKIIGQLQRRSSQAKEN